MGRKSCQLLLENIQTGNEQALDNKTITIEPSLIEREST